MPIHAVTYVYPDRPADLDAVRTEHRAFLSGLHERGTLLASGPLPATDDVTRTLHLVATGGSATAEVVTVRDGQVATDQVPLSRDHATDVPLRGSDSVWVRRAAGPGEVRGAVVSVAGEGADRLVSVVPLQRSVVTSPVSRAFPLP